MTRLRHRLRSAGARGLGERDWRPSSFSISNSARRLLWSDGTQAATVRRSATISSTSVLIGFVVAALEGLSLAVERKPAFGAGSLRLRGKDSNLDYLIQSQASYH